MKVSERSVSFAPNYSELDAPIETVSTESEDSSVQDASAVSASEAERCVQTLLRYIGEDPQRDGLLDTPQRVLKALREMTSGYDEDPSEILAKTFEVEISSDQMVLLDRIEFTSLCEHHLLPFSGTASVAYIPDRTVERPVVGLSKLARLVGCFARRLQVQERMTEQIADALEASLKPEGVGVVVRAVHSCMSCRGVEQRTSAMVTSSMRGRFATDRETRQELLSFLK